MLVFRDHRLSTAEQVAVSRAFGAPDLHAVAELRSPGRPEIAVEADGTDGRGGFGFGDLRWHADLSWTQRPNRISALPHTLSGGMKMRAAIARAPAAEPRVLPMDEPFAAPDALTRRRMQEELLRLWRAVGFTLAFVTHSIDEAVLTGSRVLRAGGAERATGRRRRGPLRLAAAHPRPAAA